MNYNGKGENPIYFVGTKHVCTFSLNPLQEIQPVRYVPKSKQDVFTKKTLEKHIRSDRVQELTVEY